MKNETKQVVWVVVCELSGRKIGTILADDNSVAAHRAVFEVFGDGHYDIYKKVNK